MPTEDPKKWIKCPWCGNYVNMEELPCPLCNWNGKDKDKDAGSDTDEE